MNIQDIEPKLIPELESLCDELGLDNIYACVWPEYCEEPEWAEWVLSVTIYLGDCKQKTVMFFDFIKENDYDVVLEHLKKAMKVNVEELKNFSKRKKEQL